jgi:Tfp pilus assembly protein PilN
MRGGAAGWTERLARPASPAQAAELRASLHAKYPGLPDAAIALLPPERVLKTALSLPRAAAQHLAEAVSYRIERLSPFPPAGTLYALLPLQDDGPGEEIEAPILIAAKDLVEDIEERAQALGFPLLGFAIEAAGPAGFERIAFAGREGRTAGLSLRIRVLLAAGALLAATLALAPVAGKSLALAKVEEETGRLKPAAEQAAKLKSARERQHGALAKAAALRRSSHPPLAILAALTEALDDASFLVELRLEGTALTISGLSGDASALAQKLAATPGFKAVKFSGPVTREARLARDRFTLALELADPS